MHEKDTRRFSAGEVLSALSDSEFRSSSTDTSDEDLSDIDVVSLPPLQNTFIKVKKVEHDNTQDVQIGNCTTVLDTLKPVGKSTFPWKEPLAPKQQTLVTNQSKKRTAAVLQKKTRGRKKEKSGHKKTSRHMYSFHYEPRLWLGRNNHFACIYSGHNTSLLSYKFR